VSGKQEHTVSEYLLTNVYVFLAHIIPMICFTKNVKFTFEIYLSLCIVDAILMSSKCHFYCIRGKKTCNILDNNFNKFKRTFIFLVGNIKKSNVTCNCWCADSLPCLISDATLLCEIQHCILRKLHAKINYLC